MSRENTSAYLKFIPDVTAAYNNRRHRAHKHRPIDVSKQNEKKIWRILYSDYLNSPKKPPKFKIGDLVRLAKKKGVFSRSYHTQWTDEIFIINAIKKTIPVTYQVKDQNNEILSGSFYAPELTLYIRN